MFVKINYFNFWLVTKTSKMLPIEFIFFIQDLIQLSYSICFLSQKIFFAGSALRPRVVYLKFYIPDKLNSIIEFNLMFFATIKSKQKYSL